MDRLSLLWIFFIPPRCSRPCSGNDQTLILADLSRKALFQVESFAPATPRTFWPRAPGPTTIPRGFPN